MNPNNFPVFNCSEQEQQNLKNKITFLQKELGEIIQKTKAFETILRSQLADEIIELQELTVLYKELKRLKKENRLVQKKKGKNYKEAKGLKVIQNKKEDVISIDDQKKLKKLYREAMLQVHPDKFSLKDENVDLATEVTTKLIEIYKSGNLRELKRYHTHIFRGNALMQSIKSVEIFGKDTFLQNELKKLSDRLELAKRKHTYKVLSEYPNPLTFIEELKDFYNDRIFKLKKRTRKAG